MEKPIQNPDVQVTTIVDITPQQLREFANRLEKALQSGGGEDAICCFTRSVTFRASREASITRQS